MNVVLIVLATLVSPGPAVVRGTIVDARTAAPIADARVAWIEGGRTAQTDAAGRFEFTGVPAGTCTLAISTVGYIFVRRTVEVTADATIDLTLPLAEGAGAYRESLTVTADAGRLPDLGVSSQADLGSAALQALRGVLADDPMRAVQALPGVATGDDFQAQFSVRGSAFRHVGIVIDGSQTQLLMHAIRGADDSGSVAMINSDVLDRASLSAGPHPQKDGDWIGATLTFDVREGSRDRNEARVGISGTSTSLVTEGPIGRSQRGSWLMSIRKSYLDWLIHKIDPSINSTLGFADLQGKFAYDLTSRQHVEFLIIGGVSRLDQIDVGLANGLGTAGSKGGLASVAWRYARQRLVVTERLSIAYNDFRNTGLLTQELARGVTRSLAWRSDASWVVSPAWTVDGGLKIDRPYASETFHAYDNPGGRRLVPRATESIFNPSVVGSAWMQAARRTSMSGVGAGIRISVDRAGRETVTSPWVLAERTFASVTLRASAGAAHQFPDVELQPISPGRRAERSVLADAGIEQRLGAGLRWQVTVFGRRDRDIIRMLGEARLLGGDVLVQESTFPSFSGTLDGSSRGVELTLSRRAAGGPTGWVSYAWSHTRYHDRVSGEDFDGDFDQRHTLNVFVQQRISYRMIVGAKLRLGSNFPIAGYFSGTPAALFVSGDRNRVRLPFYSRLDLRVARTFTFTRRRLTLFAELMNTLGRNNLGQSDGVVRASRKADNFVARLIPFVPSAGILIEFQ